MKNQVNVATSMYIIRSVGKQGGGLRIEDGMKIIRFNCTERTISVFLFCFLLFQFQTNIL